MCASGGPPGALRGRLRGERQGAAPPGPPIARQLVTCGAWGLLSVCEFPSLWGELFADIGL